MTTYLAVANADNLVIARRNDKGMHFEFARFSDIPTEWTTNLDDATPVCSSFATGYLSAGTKQGDQRIYILPLADMRCAQPRAAA